MTKKEIEQLFNEKEDMIYHWIEDGKTPVWISNFLGISYNNFLKGMKILGVTYEEIKEQINIEKNNTSFLNENIDFLLNCLIRNVTFDDVVDKLKVTDIESFEKLLYENGITLDGMAICKKKKGSKGEQRIREILNDYNVSFKEQYCFKDCIFPESNRCAIRRYL